MPDANQPIQRHVAVMRVLISLVMLVAGIAVLTAPNVIFAEKFDDGMQKIAAGWVGGVMGYWIS